MNSAAAISSAPDAAPATSLTQDFQACLQVLPAALRRAWWVAAALAVVGAALEAAAAGAVWQLLSRLGGREAIAASISTATIGWLALALVLAKNGVRLAELIVRERAVAHSAAAVSARIFRAWLRAPWREHLRAAPGQPAQESGELADRTVREVFFSIATIAAEGLVFLGLVAVLVAVAPGRLTLALALVALLVGAALAATHRWQSRWGGQLNDVAAEHAGFLGQSFAGTKELQAFARTSAWEQAQGVRRESLARVFARRVIFEQWPPVLIDTVFVGGIVAALLVAGRNAAAGNLPLVTFVAYAGFRLLPTLNRLVVRSQCLRSSRASLAVVAARLRTDVPRGEERQKNSPVAAAPPRGLAFENVSFAYAGARAPCVRDLTLRLAPGESVALMGPTGGGKTTLLHLALGLLEPTAGRVRVDGGVAAGADLRVGYVAQDGWIVDHTLAGNVALTWNPAEIERARLRDALAAAQLTDWIATLPEREDTRAGAGGQRLSGGQRQRLCLARALYARPEILFLDEATAALDPQTESALLAALHEWRPRASQLWVTHRESVARACDRVWFFVEGRLAAEGRYEELLARAPEFRAFVTRAAG